MLEYEKIQQTFWRDKTLRSLKKYKNIYPCEDNLEGQGW